MLRKIFIDLITIDADGVVEDATGDLEDVALTLIETKPADHAAHQLAFVGSTDISSSVFTIVGKDPDGRTITETVTGVTDTPVETSNHYSELTSITGSADISSATLDVGWVDEAVSPTIPINWQDERPLYVQYGESGTLETDIELLMEDPGKYASQDAAPWALYEATLDDIQDGERFSVGPGYTAARVKVNSYSTGADLTALFVCAE